MESMNWNFKDLHSRKFSKHNNKNARAGWKLYLGPSKNKKGQPINCNGIFVDAEYGKFYAGSFNNKAETKMIVDLSDLMNVEPFVYINKEELF